MFEIVPIDTPTPGDRSSLIHALGTRRRTAVAVDDDKGMAA